MSISKSVVPSHYSVHVNYDKYASWLGTPDGSTAQVVQAAGYSLMVSDISLYDSRQYELLLRAFTYYEEFRLAGYKVTYLPKFSSSSAMQGSLINHPYWAAIPAASNVPNATTGIISAQDGNASESLEVFFGRRSEICMVPDTNDNFVTQNNLSEYYMLRSTPGATVKLTTETCSVGFVPNQFDLMQGKVFGQTSVQNANIGGGPIDVQPIPSVPGQADLDTSRTMPNPWRATKVATNVQDQVNSTELNVLERLWGWKVYYYTPHNVLPIGIGGGGTVLGVGIYRIEYDIQFRNPDYRPWPTSSVLLDSAIKEQRVLRQLKGEQYLLLDHDTPPVMTNTKRALTVLAEEKEYDARQTPSNLTIHEGAAPPKKTKPDPTAPASQEPSSRQTPSLHLHRTPLGLPGSKRT